MPVSDRPAGQLHPHLARRGWRRPRGSRRAAGWRPGRRGRPATRASRSAQRGQQRDEHRRLRSTSTPSAASDVAPGWSAGAAATFSPIPMTTAGRSRRPPRRGCPATLRCPRARAAGRWATSARPGRRRGSRTASSTASPRAAAASRAATAARPSGRSSTLTVSPEPGGETQLRGRAARARPPGARRRARCGRGRPRRRRPAGRRSWSRCAPRRPAAPTGRPARRAAASASSGRAVRFMRADATARTGGVARPRDDGRPATSGRPASPTDVTETAFRHAVHAAGLGSAAMTAAG